MTASLRSVAPVTDATSCPRRHRRVRARSVVR